VVGLKRFCSILLLFALFVFPFSAPSEASRGGFAASRVATDENGAEYVEGEVLVQLSYSSAGARANAAEVFAASRGMSVAAQYGALSRAKGKTLLHLKSDYKTTARMMLELSADSRVEIVEPNYIRRIQAAPDDTHFGVLWGMRNTGQSGGTAGADISATDAWDVRTDASDVVVAVLDTGVHYGHEDLAANMWDGAALGFPNHGWNFVDNTDDPYDIDGHGTHCAGTIGAAGNNAKGVAGVAWNVKIMAVKILNDLGSGTTDMALGGYEWVLARKNAGVNIVAINASYGGDPYSQIEENAIAALGDAGILFVAAAGNENTDNDADPHYPASYNLPNIISVAASGRNDERADFSNFGAASVHLAAPGAGILSTVPEVTAVATPFSDDMEGGAAKWEEGAWTYVDPGQGTFAPVDTPWEIDDSIFNSPTHSWNSNPASAQGTYHGIASTAVDLGAHAGKRLSLEFWTNYSVGAGNFFDIYISKDNGASWALLKRLNGSSEENLKMPAYAIPSDYTTNEFRVGFGLKMNVAAGGDFVHIDDVKVVAKEVTGSAYEEYNGTSMAAPHVTGAVALVAAQYPGETVAERRARILENVDVLPAWNGVVSTGGRLNLARAIEPTPTPHRGGGCNAGSFSSSILLLALPLLLLFKYR
jgi:subtilisin family serine protease